MDQEAKPLFFIGASHRAYTSFPDEVQAAKGYALWVSQTCGKHESAKPLTGFGGAGVLPVVVEDHHGDSYRAIYTVGLASAVYLLRQGTAEAGEGPL